MDFISQDVLIAMPQNGGHDARTSPAMDHRNNPERMFIWCINDQIIPHTFESQGPGCQIRAAMSLLRKRYKRTQALEDFRYDAAGGLRIVMRNVFPNFLMSLRASGWSE
jgi:hypothetical protein